MKKDYKLLDKCRGIYPGYEGTFFVTGGERLDKGFEVRGKVLKLIETRNFCLVLFVTPEGTKSLRILD